MLHNLCIIKNEGIEEDLIVEGKIKPTKRVSDGKFQGESTLRGEIMGFAEVKKMILAKDDAPISY